MKSFIRILFSRERRKIDYKDYPLAAFYCECDGCMGRRKALLKRRKTDDLGHRKVY